MPENIDLLYEVTSHIHAWAVWLAAAVCLVFLCGDFLKEKKGRWLIGAAYFITLAVLYYIPFLLSGFVAYMLAALAGFVVFIWLDRECIRLKVFLFFTFFTEQWFVSSLSNGISRVLYHAVFRFMDRIYDMADPATWKIYYAEFVLNMASQTILYSVILYTLIRQGNRRFLYKQKELDFRELIFLLIPSANGIIISRLFMIYVPFYEEKNNISIFQMNLTAEFLWIFCYAIILASIVSTMILYQSIRKKQDEENTRLILESQIRDIQTHISEVEKLYTDIRGVKHDIKNHIEVINSLLAQGKTKEAQEYAKSLSDTAETLDFSIKTGNPITDVIIREKRELAEKRGIEFASDFHYPSDTEMNAFDVSVILSNALSNAIEAADADGFVKVSSFRNKNVYMIIVENSFDGKLEVDAVSGLPETRKSDKKTHGFGLQNIRSVAVKYYGEVQIEQEGKKVKLTVMLLVSA